MRMFNVLPKLIKNTVRKLTHLTCNSPKKKSLVPCQSECDHTRRIYHFQQVLMQPITSTWYQSILLLSYPPRGIVAFTLRNGIICTTARMVRSEQKKETP